MVAPHGDPSTEKKRESALVLVFMLAARNHILLREGERERE